MFNSWIFIQTLCLYPLNRDNKSNNYTHKFKKHTATDIDANCSTEIEMIKSNNYTHVNSENTQQLKIKINCSTKTEIINQRLKLKICTSKSTQQLPLMLLVQPKQRLVSVVLELSRRQILMPSLVLANKIDIVKLYTEKNVWYVCGSRSGMICVVF